MADQRPRPTYLVPGADDDDRPVRYRPTRYVPARSAGAHAHVAQDRVRPSLTAAEIVLAVVVGLALIFAVGYVLDGLAFFCGGPC